MIRSFTFLLLLLIVHTSSAQTVLKMPDACTLITSTDINGLFGTIVKQQESHSPANTLCTFRSDDNAAEVIIQYKNLTTPDAATAYLKQIGDSVKMAIESAKPIIYTTVADIENSGAGGNYMSGEDKLYGPINRVQFALDKFIVVIETKGIAQKALSEHISEIHKIIKRNSGIE